MIDTILHSLVILISCTYLVIGTVSFIQRKRRQSVIKYATLVIVWGTILLVALHIIPTSKNISTLIMLGFTLICMVLYRLLHIVEKIEENMTEIVRSEALKNVQLPSKKRRLQYR